MTDNAEDMIPSPEGEAVAKALTDGLVDGEDKHALFMLTSRLPELGLPTGELSAYLFLATANADAIGEAVATGQLDGSHNVGVRAALPSQIAAAEFLAKRLKATQAVLEAKEKAK